MLGRYWASVVGLCLVSDLLIWVDLELALVCIGIAISLLVKLQKIIIEMIILIHQHRSVTNFKGAKLHILL